jgi:hypothetical protein
MEIRAVEIVKVKNKFPLFKGEEVANSIEKIELEEYGYSLVAQKDLYEIGESVIYIQPDYSLSDISLFESFIRPNGDPKKSRLGSNNRIRAVKFNLHTGDSEPTYSVGILLPIDVVVNYLIEAKLIKNALQIKEIDLTKSLGITKWEEPDNVGGSGVKTNGGYNYPSTIYRTDEENTHKMWKHIENKIGYPITLVGSTKVDGSSLSIILKNDDISVGSRNLIKPMKITKTTGIRKPNFLERILIFFGKKVDLLTKEVVDNDDQFIDLAKPYIEKIKTYLSDNPKYKNLVFRGEANGQSWKGSGNSNNPDSKNLPNIKFFGIDLYDDVATKLPESEFAELIEKIGLERTKVIFHKQFNSREEIEKECNDYFKENLIEGIVLRTEDSKFSSKFMNNFYDSKKG